MMAPPSHRISRNHPKPPYIRRHERGAAVNPPPARLWKESLRLFPRNIDARDLHQRVSKRIVDRSLSPCSVRHKNYMGMSLCDSFSGALRRLP